MTQANISQLKNGLSAYVARARAGEAVLILDRHTPVARLVPVEAGPALVVREPKFRASAARGKKRIHLKKAVDVLAMLRDDRDHR